MDKKAGKRHLCLVDGSGFIFRAFYSLPPLTREDGTPVNAVLGFCNMLYALSQEVVCDAMAILFDTKHPTFRHHLFTEYKANRDAPPEELVPQFPLIREATRAFGFPAIEQAGFEADDLIATYARMAVEEGWKVSVVSSDKDLMQLVRTDVFLIDPKTMKRVGPDEVKAKFGVLPNRVVDVQALAGDSTDNVPGIRGIGLKTAALLINEYGTLDDLLERAGEIKQPKRREALLDQAEMARLSRVLVTLKEDVPVKEELSSLEGSAPDPKVLRDFLTAQNFKALLRRLQLQLQAAPTDASDLTENGDTLPQPSYELIQTTERLQSWIDEAKRMGWVSVDTETTSLDAMAAELVGVSLATTAGRACYVPLSHVVPNGNLGENGVGQIVDGQIPMAKALNVLRPLLEDPSVIKIGQNLKYDMLVLRKEPYGIRLHPIDDTMVMSFVLDAGRGGHGMDELSRRHLDVQPIVYKDVVGSGMQQVTFNEVSLKNACNYAAEDADITLRLHDLFKRRLLKERMSTVYEVLERPLAGVLVEMEASGIAVSPKVLCNLSKDFSKRIEELSDKIHRLAGREFNIGSPKQLGVVLFDELGLSGGKKTKTGAYGTGADVLEALAADGSELAAEVLAWRQLSKLKSTYTDALITQINRVTGRVHTSFSMVGASTGRLSSTNPNLQNIPIRTEEGRKIRAAFVAGEGCKLLSADYSQIELRLLADIANITALREAFGRGEDIHALTASQVFGIGLADVDGATRRSAKAINFGIIYGQSAFGLAKQLGIPQWEAKEYIKLYFEKYPGIPSYMERTKDLARTYGFVETIFGRRCHITGINEKNAARRNYAERQAINAPIQGSAADIIKRAMVRVPVVLKEANLKAKMLLQVHDELLLEVPEDEITQTGNLVGKIMEEAALPSKKLAVPLTVKIGFGDNWFEAH
jgi:DNA polymerase-1